MIHESKDGQGKQGENMRNGIQMERRYSGQKSDKIEQWSQITGRKDTHFLYILECHSHLSTSIFPWNEIIS